MSDATTASVLKIQMEFSNMNPIDFIYKYFQASKGLERKILWMIGDVYRKDIGSKLPKYKAGQTDLAPEPPETKIIKSARAKMATHKANAGVVMAKDHQRIRSAKKGGALPLLIRSIVRQDSVSIGYDPSAARYVERFQAMHEMETHHKRSALIDVRMAYGEKKMRQVFPHGTNTTAIALARPYMQPTADDPELLQKCAKAVHNRIIGILKAKQKGAKPIARYDQRKVM